MQTAETDFRAGLDVLTPFFEQQDFKLQLPPMQQTGSGIVYSARYVWGNHAVTIVHTDVPVSVTYSVGGVAIDHASYVDALGVGMGAAFPAATGDSAARYAALLADLGTLLTPFFEEPDREFMEVAAEVNRRRARP